MTKMSQTRSRTGWIIAVVIVIVVIVIAGVLLFQFMQPNNNTPTGNSVDIYGAEYKFGTSQSNMASPGPTLNFKAGQTVTVTFHNVGTGPHNFAIVTDKADGSTNLAFNGAQIASATNPVAVGQSASVTFTVGTAGTYYYICQVDGHVSLGMWGTVTVT
jgi:plastocyanin